MVEKNNIDILRLGWIKEPVQKMQELEFRARIWLLV